VIRRVLALRSLEFDAKAKAAATYNAAADRYDDQLNSFWARFGHCTIDRRNLQSGQRVLDVCCGSVRYSGSRKSGA
jgi:ubiquinone/menaquinone biosynthesis C-methylase UbiE